MDHPGAAFGEELDSARAVGCKCLSPDLSIYHFAAANQQPQRTAEREAYRTAYAQAWTATADADGDGQEVDVILCPPSFGAAPPFGQSKYWGYTANWNLLDYPGVVFPVTTVDSQKDPKDVDYEPKNAEDKFCHELYDPEVYANAPVGLQIVGRRQYDEKVLAALVEIERAMGRK